MRSPGSTAPSRFVLARPAFAGLLLQTTGLFAGLMTNIILARGLGVRGFGLFSTALAWIVVGQIVASSGLAPLVTRHAAVGRARGRTGDGLRVLRWSLRRVGWASLLSAAGLLVVAAAVLEPFEFILVLLAAPVVLVAALLALVRGFLNGDGRVVLARLPELCIQPLALLVGMLLLLLLAESFAPSVAVGLYVASWLVASLGGYILLRRSSAEWRSDAMKECLPEDRVADLRADAWPFFKMNLIGLVSGRLDLVMVSGLGAVSDVGVFRVALVASSLLSFGLQAVNVAIAPQVVRSWEARRLRELQIVAVRGARLATMFSALGLLCVAFFGRSLLVWAFGVEFESAYTPLLVLCVGQLANALCGSVGTCLNMAGLQHLTLRGMTMSAAVAVTVHFVLIPQIGALGASIATAVAMAAWNLILVYYCRREMNVWTVAVAPLGE